MEVNDVILTDNKLKAVCNINMPTSRSLNDVTSTEFMLLDGAVSFQIRLLGTCVKTHVIDGYCTKVSSSTVNVKLLRRQFDDDVLDYAMTLINPENKFPKTIIKTNTVWQLLYSITGLSSYALTINTAIEPKMKPFPITFSALHDDTEMTDFELRGEDGAPVAVHRSALAAASPVLRRMLANDMREAKEGYVQLPNVSATTLQHLKDYIYLDVLPEKDVDHLLLLASKYMIQTLEERCVKQLIENVCPENVAEIIELAKNPQTNSLLIELFECVETGSVKVKDIRTSLSKKYDSNKDL